MALWRVMTQIYDHALHSGIDLLLQGNEQEAQVTWLCAIDQLTESETAQFCLDLAAALATAGNEQIALGDWSMAWVLYRYACENLPSLENWLQALQASLLSVGISQEDDLEPDWEALDQSLEILKDQKFVITPELTPLVLAILEILRSHYPERLENLDVDTYYYLGLLYRREQKIYEALAAFQEAVNLAPERIDIYEHLIGSLEILMISGSQKVYSDWRQVTDIYVDVCAKLGELSDLPSDRLHLASAIHRLKSYLMSGMYADAQTYFVEIETHIYENTEYLTLQNWKSLYVVFLFFIPFLRDNPILNGRLFAFIADHYRKFYLTSFFEKYPQFQLVPKFSSIAVSDVPTDIPNVAPKRSLRIGIMSGLFRRHAMSWCTKDWLLQLAHLAPDVRFYLTEQFPPDDITQMFAQFGDRFYKIQSQGEEPQIAETIQRLIDDDLDILIEMDSIMNPRHAPIVAAKPAKHCISWPGFSSPYITDSNYFLGDRHLLPSEVEPYILEKILRMPDSYLAVSELASLPIDRQAMRASLGIEPHQIVYLSISAGHKFNPDNANAMIQILQRVPDSILLHKGRADLDITKATYAQACDRFHVNSDRIKFLPPRTKTEEEHRSTYQLADVLLDSHPYNSCTHSLEAFWQNLPVVTIVGQQMFSRFGYSFFQTLGIQDGIAWNWEEYVQWGERLGKDHDLRASLRSQLYQSKQPETLSPLWNPSKFAQDLYDLLLAL